MITTVGLFGPDGSVISHQAYRLKPDSVANAQPAKQVC
jgi:hypothetical protein